MHKWLVTQTRACCPSTVVLFSSLTTVGIPSYGTRIERVTALTDKPGRGAIMKPSEALAIYRAPLRQLMNRYGFTHPRVFGSVLTMTDTEDSDLDLLVEPAPGTTLFMLVGVEEEAQRLTGVRVSVLTPGFLSPKFRDKVLARAEPL